MSRQHSLNQCPHCASNLPEDGRACACRAAAGGLNILFSVVLAAVILLSLVYLFQREAKDGSSLSDSEILSRDLRTLTQRSGSEAAAFQPPPGLEGFIDPTVQTDIYDLLASFSQADANGPQDFARIERKGADIPVSVTRSTQATADSLHGPVTLFRGTLRNQMDQTVSQVRIAALLYDGRGKVLEERMFPLLNLSLDDARDCSPKLLWDMASNAAGITIPPGGERPFSVWFQPLPKGSRRITVRVQSVSIRKE